MLGGVPWMRGIFQGAFAPGEEMDGTGLTVLAVDFGIPAAQAFFAHHNVVLQTDIACFGIRMMVTGHHRPPPFRKTAIIEGVRSSTWSALRPHDPAATQASCQSSRLNWLSVSEEQQADFDIVTAEGDTVTLSSDCRAAATLATYEHLALSDSGYRRIEAQMQDFQMERDIGVTVEGDLNPQELADIRSLLSDLGEMFKEFLASENRSAPID